MGFFSSCYHVQKAVFELRKSYRSGFSINITVITLISHWYHVDITLTLVTIDGVAETLDCNSLFARASNGFDGSVIWPIWPLPQAESKTPVLVSWRCRWVCGTTRRSVLCIRRYVQAYAAGGTRYRVHGQGHQPGQSLLNAYTVGDSVYLDKTTCTVMMEDGFSRSQY